MAANTTILSIAVAFLTAILALFIISILPGLFGTLPSFISSFLLLIGLPLMAYVFSIGGSLLTQFSACSKIDTKSIFTGNLFVLLSAGFASTVLFMESVPVLKYIFGAYPPSDPVTGEPLDPSSEAYTVALQSEKHYKIQFFSNIVKAVLPTALSDQWKDGLASMYWIFFLTLLPSFFLFTVQASCPKASASGPK